MQGHLLYELCARSHAAVELRAIRQGREGTSEVACGVAIEVPLAAKAGPTGEDGEGYELALGERRLGTGLPFRPMGVAKVVHHDVKCGKEGVHTGHKSSVPFPLGSGSKPTLVCGHLPLKSSTVTHTKRLSYDAAWKATAPASWYGYTGIAPSTLLRRSWSRSYLPAIGYQEVVTSFW